MSKKRVSLTLDKRIEVIEYHENGYSERKLSEMFGCGKTQINKILRDKVKIREEWGNFKILGVKRHRGEKFPEINEALKEWLKFAQSINIPISGTLMKQQAMEIAENLGIKDFSASNGWLDKFRIRNNVVFRAPDVDDLCQDWKTKLPYLLYGYSDKDIFTMDETALFFRALPDKSMIVKSIDSKEGNLANERITTLFCVSAMGEKVEPLMICNSLNLRCFNGKDISKLGVQCKSNKKAWMNAAIFEDWLAGFDKKMAKEGRHVLLFLDNATSHKCETVLSNVKLVFFPSNTTSKLQPLDNGIIKWFKLKYRRYVLQSIIARMDESMNASELAQKITVADAVEWAKSAWKDLDSDLIVSCFSSCGMTNSSTENRMCLPHEMIKDDEVVELSRLAGIEYDPSALENENTLECCYNLSENWEELMENVGCQAIDMESEEILPDNVTLNTQPALTAQQTLKQIDFIMKNSKCMSDYNISTLFKELKNKLEIEVLTEKRMKIEQSEMAENNMALIF